jgi:hypothetical protein
MTKNLYTVNDDYNLRQAASAALDWITSVTGEQIPYIGSVERDLRSALTQAITASWPSRCKVCGKTIAEHDKLMRCPDPEPPPDVEDMDFDEQVQNLFDTLCGPSGGVQPTTDPRSGYTNGYRDAINDVLLNGIEWARTEGVLK